MTKILRIKIAREYVVLLGRLGEPKKAMLKVTMKHMVSRRSVYNYVREFRRQAVRDTITHKAMFDELKYPPDCYVFCGAPVPATVSNWWDHVDCDACKKLRKP